MNTNGYGNIHNDYNDSFGITNFQNGFTPYNEHKFGPHTLTTQITLITTTNNDIDPTMTDQRIFRVMVEMRWCIHHQIFTEMEVDCIGKNRMRTLQVQSKISRDFNKKKLVVWAN